MPKQISPYQAAVSVNNEILFHAANIAYEAGRNSLAPAFGRDMGILCKEIKAVLSLEGKTLTPSQMRALERGEELKTMQEANALRRLFLKMGRIDPYDPSFFQEYEKEMFPNGVPTRLSRRVESFPYPIPLKAKVPAMVKGFYSFAKKGQSRHPLIVAALFYFEIMALQPYSTGTEPLALYLMKAVLVNYEKSFLNAPILVAFASNYESLQEAYKESVEKADTAPFVLKALSVFEKAIHQAEKKAMREKNQGTPLVDKLLSKMEEGKFYSAQDLLALLGLTSRLGLAKNYLRPALEAGLLERSNPLVPTDRNQRYRKVNP